MWDQFVERIQQMASTMELWQYILIYVACFVLAIVFAAVGGQRSRGFREGVISILALFGGMLAVGYVTCKLGANPGLLILLVVAIPAGIIGYPAGRIADRPRRKAQRSQHQDSPTSTSASASPSNSYPSSNSTQAVEEEDSLPYSPIVTDPDAVPAWAAKEVYNNIDDPAILAELAMSAPLEDVRKAAVGKIKDQQVLYEVALHDHGADGMKRSVRVGTVEELAAERLTDPALFKRLALEVGNGNWVYGKLDRLSQSDLAEVACNAKDGLTRKYATDLITDDEALAHIAVSDNENAIWAVGRMHDKGLLRRVFDDSTNRAIRAKAIAQAGGYLCHGCGRETWPEGDEPVPCACPACGVKNHDWKHVNGEIVHRDYSSGTSYDVCRRCGEKKNFINHGDW